MPPSHCRVLPGGFIKSWLTSRVCLSVWRTLRRAWPRMAAQDWLGSYREFAVLEQVVAGIDRRLSRPGLLAGGAAELERLYQPLLEDFRQFYPELQAFVARERGLVD